MFPPAAAFTALSVIQLANQAATIINLFFLIRHVIVPPAKHFVEKLAHHFGHHISGQYYSKPALDLKKDRFVVDKILEKDYGHDTYSSQYRPEQLSNLNRLLTKLINYMNKYDQALFGYVKNKSKIAVIEKNIEQLTINGDSDSSYGFIVSANPTPSTQTH